MTFSEIKELDQTYVAHTYGRANFALKCGKGSTCEDFDGKSYIDFSSGIGVNSLGFADPEWVKAVSEQASCFAHISNLYFTAPGALTAKQLCEKSGMKKVFFGNSGAEANEGMIKAARKYAQAKYGKERYEIITLINSFHGRTITTVAATGQVSMHVNFDPFTPGFVYAEANNFNDVVSKVSDKTAAIMMEMVQGEGGVIPLDADFVKKITALCTEKDILLLVDEVQTGIGRTGYFYSFQAFDIQPDIVSSAKGLGGGLPIGAVLFGEKTAETFAPGDHGSTFGMNPIACAGANVVLNRLTDAFLADVTRKGKKLTDAIEKCANVESITGMGMMIGVMPKKGTSKEIVAKCLEKGLIVLTAHEKVRLLPPLVITDAELEQGLAILLEVFEEAGNA
ncbi:acetylornithine/succinylornithine family transaminase [Oscillospiraceae bacterium LTW-04]|nr:acetylornithine/succinylornithine family transaminase [Oscillospiraceae bacterium MB24-C1]